MLKSTSIIFALSAEYAFAQSGRGGLGYHPEDYSSGGGGSSEASWICLLIGIGIVITIGIFSTISDEREKIAREQKHAAECAEILSLDPDRLTKNEQRFLNAVKKRNPNGGSNLSMTMQEREELKKAAARIRYQNNKL